MIELAMDATPLLGRPGDHGRYARCALTAVAETPTILLTLIVAERDTDLMRSRLTQSTVRIAGPRAVRRGRFDLVWFPTETLRFPTESPRISTIHDVFAITSPRGGFFTRRAAKRTLITTARESDHLLALSAWSRDRISAALDVNPQAVTVATPMPEAEWCPELEAPAYPDLVDMPYVLFVAERGPDAGHELLFDAFRHAFKRRPIRLVICGELDARLLARTERVENVRVVSPDAMERRSLYRNAIAVVIPNAQSSYSFAAAEAAACGAAVLAADAAGLAETIGESALLVAAHDRKAWTESMRSVVDDPAANARLRARAVNHWSSISRNRFGHALLDGFREALSQ